MIRNIGKTVKTYILHVDRLCPYVCLFRRIHLVSYTALKQPVTLMIHKQHCFDKTIPTFHWREAAPNLRCAGEPEKDKLIKCS